MYHSFLIYSSAAQSQKNEFAFFIRCREAQLAIFKQMIGQVSRGSSGEYQADERAAVVRFSWRLSGR